MRYTDPSQLPEYSRRLNANNPDLFPDAKAAVPEPTPLPRPERLTESERYAVSNELALHNDIIKWCNDQMPRWKYIHANPSQKSCIAKGCQDFTVFAPGRVIIFECKNKDGKLDSDQQIWRKEMEMLGHDVPIVRSMQDFFALVNKTPTPAENG